MKILPLTSLVALCALAGAAAAQTVLPESSEIRFVTRQMGVPVEGRFTRWQAQVKFDPAQLSASQVGFSIDTRSIAFGAADAEAEAAKPAWFNSAQFPQAQFKSGAIKFNGPGRYEVAGTLTIKGQSREVVVPVLMVPGPVRGQATASGSFTLKRMDFLLGEGEWSDLSVVANDVQVRFKLQLAGLLPP